MNSEKYYDQNADIFFDRTINSDMSHIYERFLLHIPKNSTILDTGCGTGRDGKYFQNLGHEVTAFDASIEMVKRSSAVLGKKTLHLYFQDITFENKFDAIWAAASLIHVPYDMMRNIFTKLHKALKPSGIFYASFFCGDTQRNIDGRTFYDLGEDTFPAYVKGLFEIIEMWHSPAKRSRRVAGAAKEWLNVLCRKIEE